MFMLAIDYLAWQRENTEMGVPYERLSHGQGSLECFVRQVWRVAGVGEKQFISVGGPERTLQRRQ